MNIVYFPILFPPISTSDYYNTFNYIIKLNEKNLIIINI